MLNGRTELAEVTRMIIMILLFIIQVARCNDRIRRPIPGTGSI